MVESEMMMACLDWCLKMMAEMKQGDGKCSPVAEAFCYVAAVMFFCDD
jgi:hypothetical protein